MPTQHKGIVDLYNCPMRQPSTDYQINQPTNSESGLAEITALQPMLAKRLTKQGIFTAQPIFKKGLEP